MNITKEQREYLDKLAISAIKELKSSTKKDVCYNCLETNELYFGNRKNLLFARCRLCNLKQVIMIRFSKTKPISEKIANLIEIDSNTLKKLEEFEKLYTI